MKQPVGRVVVAQRLHGIPHEVEHHLLDLNAVGGHGRQGFGQALLEGDIAPVNVVSRQIQHVVEDGIQIDHLAFRLAFVHKASQPANDLPGPAGLAADLIDRLVEPGEVVRVVCGGGLAFVAAVGGLRGQGVEPMLAALDVVADGGQGLI